MAVVVITGSAGLIGAEAARFFAGQGFDVVGIDNDMRRYFFGAEASTQLSRVRLEQAFRCYRHVDVDIRDRDAIERLFASLHGAVHAVIHTASQPSHEWAAREPGTDFAVNAVGTLNLLDAAREHCPEAPFVFTSTNKVYGDTPNSLPLVEGPTRYELADDHAWAAKGIDETMSIDRSLHSLFGASKASADLMVQEYGRYFGMPSVCFRGGCLTGPGHASAELHGFLAYLVHCCADGRPYRVFGYKGKQVRDNLHAADLVAAFWEFVKAPRPAAVYNIGGGRTSNCSMLEAIELAERATGRKLTWSYEDGSRRGDHIWWISDTSAFQRDYPNWRVTRDVPAIVDEIAARCAKTPA